MNKICELIKNKRIYFDGGMGSMLQKRGLLPGELPENWNIEHPDIITDIHREYLLSGANVITTNTFGVNSLKHSNYDELIKFAIDCAKKACSEYEDAFVAFDIGPLGRFLEPIGDLPFEKAVSIFADSVRSAVKYGADLIIIETMTDSYETKAAVIAAKENSDLPIFVTHVYDERGKMLTGADPMSMISMLEGLGVDAIGINCSLGPDKMLPVLQKYCKYSSLPIICNPNAGLPEIVNGQAHYTMGADEFSDFAVKLAKEGASILGGCCGTEPDYIRLTVEKTKTIPLPKVVDKGITVVSSYTNAIEIGKTPVLIGERINPTGRSAFKQALRENNMNYILAQAIEQADAGAHILDVNVGLPEISEKEMMLSAIKSIQAVCDLPLCIDSNNPDVLESAMRVYNGKPMINSINGDDQSIDTILPLVKKYGGTVIALTLNKNGIPESTEERIEIAKYIIERAKAYGISKKDIIFDPLALTNATNPNNAKITANTVSELNKLGLKTSLGISNVSFGMPNRPLINASFLGMALLNGLSCAIINPCSESIMNVYRSFIENDEITMEELEKAMIFTPNTDPASDTVNTLKDFIVKGLVDATCNKANELIEAESPLDIINNEIIPALDEVGRKFEDKKIYLPQLLMSAECSSKAFAILKEKMPSASENGNGVIMATVKGDIHDIGKNIVKLLLESYGFTVYDLGKDVAPQTILEATQKYNCNMVGLSALMTTTLPAMKETVSLLHQHSSDIKVMVGGAVLTEEYACMINADAYAKDAMDAVKCVKRFYE